MRAQIPRSTSGRARPRTRWQADSASEGELAAAAAAAAASREPTFTLEQVKAIVQRAVEERDAQLREEYDAILAAKLNEQFENFTRFNLDYIHRQLKQSAFSYVG